MQNRVNSRRACILGHTWLMIFALLIGCSSTRPRMVVNLATQTPGYKRVALLTPQITVQAQYVYTRHYEPSQELARKYRRQVHDALQDALQVLGYMPYEQAKVTQFVKAPVAELDKLQKQLQELAQTIRRQDPYYHEESLAAVKLPTLNSLPAGLDNFDLVVCVWGTARLEGTKDFWWRWLHNIPGIIFLPLAPFMVEDSPDQAWIRLMVVDTHQQQVVFYNDYYKRHWSLGEQEFYNAIRKLLAPFPRRAIAAQPAPAVQQADPNSRKLQDKKPPSRAQKSSNAQQANTLSEHDTPSDNTNPRTGTLRQAP